MTNHVVMHRTCFAVLVDCESFQIKRICFALVFVIVSLSVDRVCAAQPISRADAIAAMHHAVTFFREQASAHGGYVFRWSDDLSRREGELKVDASTAWIEPPSTPSVGQAYLDAYRLTGDRMLIDAARETATALMLGQLVSGGWGEQIEFAPAERMRYAYRTDSHDTKKRRNMSTLDDNKTQSVVRFMMQLDITLDEKDPALHEATQYALQSLVDAQYANGAWPQRYDGQREQSDVSILKASYPDQWSRTFPAEKYDTLFTLNDDTLCDMINTMFDAWDLYRDQRYLAAAIRGGEFLLLAQMPTPQPGWAQQYDRHMHPAWARKFEPPAISGGESQQVMRTLLMLYQRTAQTRFLAAVQVALPYYKNSLLGDGQLPRFLELQSNRPLYLNRKYELTYSDNDLPTHYGFKVRSSLEQIENQLNEIQSTPKDRLWNPQPQKPTKMSRKLGDAATRIVQTLDDRGAWVESGKLKTHETTPGHRMITSSTFIKNLRTLAEFVAAASE